MLNSAKTWVLLCQTPHLPLTHCKQRELLLLLEKKSTRIHARCFCISETCKVEFFNSDFHTAAGYSPNLHVQ